MKKTTAGSGLVKLDKVFLLFTCMLLLCGCATTYTPIPEGYNGPLVTVMDTSKIISKTKVHFFQLSKIDGRKVKTSSRETSEYNNGMGLSMITRTAERRVPAGKSILSIEGTTHVAAPILSLGGKMYRLKGDVEVELKHGTIYAIKGELSKDHCAVWVETIDQEIVSKKIEKFGECDMNSFPD